MRIGALRWACVDRIGTGPPVCGSGTEHAVDRATVRHELD